MGNLEQNRSSNRQRTVPRGQRQDARHVSERYIVKSEPYIVMVSTPNAPEGLFDKMEKEPDKQCIYKRLKFDYRYGLGKIYIQAEIERALPVIVVLLIKPARSTSCSLTDNVLVPIPLLILKIDQIYFVLVISYFLICEVRIYVQES